jgi:hypothetical protein
VASRIAPVVSSSHVDWLVGKNIRDGESWRGFPTNG